MADRVSAETVPTVRATLERAGRTDRPKIVIPEDVSVPVGEVVRLALGGRTYFARVERAIDDTLEFRGAYDNARQAREGDGVNRLTEWAERKALDFGRSVQLDLVEEDFFYGVRAPGETAVYEVPDKPDDSLANIAKEVSDDE
ncbi:DUF7112 family protein [Natronomonas sp. EA1]|uniref:DUF7112 family protein n=1 Tax=Natronomonas sp. EA1 TaxID=3421655 RepID=UPI003EB8FE62